MDADGNGVVNNFDYLAIKMNWLKSQVSVPDKSGGGPGPDSFEMSNNYPNPFNPSTTISYSLPEKSSVTLVVSDMLGRTVATLVEDVVEAGEYSATFDAGMLNSGTYMATGSMTGVESGLTFRKNIKMLLSK